MATLDPLLEAYRRESDALIAQRLPRAVATAIGALGAVSLAVFLLRPRASLSMWLFYVLAQSGVALLALAALPRLQRVRWQRPLAVATAVALFALFALALGSAGAPASLVVPIALLACVAAPLALPWGAGNQACFALAPAVATAALVAATADTETTLLAATAAGFAAGVSVLCAYQLDLHRFAIFAEALQRERGASLESRLLSVLESIEIRLDDPAALDSIAAAVREALRREWALIFLRDGKRGVSRIVGGSGHSDLEIDSVRSLELGDREMPLLGEIAGRGQVEIAHVNRGDRALPPLLERWRCASLLGAALKRGDEVVGVLLVGASRRARPLDAAGRRLFAEIARRTAAAVANVRYLGELREGSNRKSEFLATVSHELRSPLDVIVGYADMLEDPAFGELSLAQRDMVERLRAHSVNLAEFASATLEMQGLESDEPDEPLRWIDVQTLLHDMRCDARVLPRRPGVALEWDAIDKPLRVFTDPHKLRVVVKNLVGNALKFTDSGRVVACVHVDQTHQRLEISVRDTGRGVDKAELPRLFEMFRQGSNCAGDPSLSGVGLGLYIVRSFVEQLGGTVGAHSEPGRGSIFRVSLPLQSDATSRAARAAAKLVA